MKMYLRKTEGLSNFSFTRHETTAFRCGEDVPANDNCVFYDVIYEGKESGFECETEDDALELYECRTSELLWSDGKRSSSIFPVTIVSKNIEGEEIGRVQRKAFIDSRSDTYDHGRFDYYNSRI